MSHPLPAREYGDLNEPWVWVETPVGQVQVFDQGGNLLATLNETLPIEIARLVGDAIARGSERPVLGIVVKKWADLLLRALEEDRRQA